MGASLWLLVHLGSNTRMAHILTLAVEASNSVFNDLDIDQQSDVLSLVLEVSSSSRRFTSELAQLVNIGDADIGNFIQRWMMLKVTEVYYQQYNSSSSSVGSDRSDRSNSKMSMSDNRSFVHRKVLNSTVSEPESRRIVDTIPRLFCKSTNSDETTASVTSSTAGGFSPSEEQLGQKPPIQQQKPAAKEGTGGLGFWKILSQELGFL